MNNSRFKPVCLLIIDGFHADFLLNELSLDMNKLKDIFPVLLLKSNDKNIENPYNSYFELGTGMSLDDASRVSDISLSKAISFAGLKQLHIAHSENYANITYFFNGKNKEKHDKEDWAVVPSKKSDNYINELDGVVSKVTNRVVKEIESQDYDFIVFNYPNLIGGTEDKLKSLKMIDINLKKIINHILAYNGILLISSNTSFVKNNNIVPLFFISKQWKDKSHIDYDYSKKIIDQIPSGWTYDIAPTIVKIMGISKPQQMQGSSLI